LKEIFLLIFFVILVIFITGILINPFANNNSDIIKEVFKALIDLSIPVLIGSILVTIASSLYNTHQEYNKVRKDLIEELLHSYNKVKKIRRIQKYEKSDTLDFIEIQFHDLIDVQLEFEYYMNQIDLYRNIFEKEKAILLLHMAHQMERYLNKLLQEFGDLIKSKKGNIEKTKTQNKIEEDNEKIREFVNDDGFNRDFTEFFHVSLYLIRNDFLSHTQRSIKSEEWSIINSILTSKEYKDFLKEIKEED
jgi:hypothetical protein